MREKETTVWCILTPHGAVLPFLTRASRRQAKGDAAGWAGAPWKALQAAGYTCRKAVLYVVH